MIGILATTLFATFLGMFAAFWAASRDGREIAAYLRKNRPTLWSELALPEDLDDGVSWAFYKFLWSRGYETVGNSDIIFQGSRARRRLMASACLLALFVAGAVAHIWLIGR